MRVRACGEKKFLKTDRAVHELVLCVDDEETLHRQPSGAEKRWRRSAVRTRAGAEDEGELHHGSGTRKSAEEMERHRTSG